MRVLVLLLALFMSGCATTPDDETIQHVDVFDFRLNNDGNADLEYVVSLIQPSGARIWSQSGSIAPGESVMKLESTAQPGNYTMEFDVEAPNGRYWGTPEFTTACDEPAMKLHLSIGATGGLLHGSTTGGIEGHTESACVNR